MRVIIVGAGPAGLISSLYLIKEGLSPLILDKGSVIKSTACAEACGAESLNRIPFYSEQYISKYLKGARLIYPDGKCSYIYKKSVTLDRTNWLRGMAREIEKRAGQIRLNSRVVNVKEDCVQLANGERLDYDILVGADGPNSLVAKYMGVKHRLAAVCQYKLAYDTSGMDYLEFYIDRKFSPDYAWIFPKEGVINVGTEGSFAKLDAFLADKGLSDCKVIGKEAGILPTSGVQRLVRRNMALIGDAVSTTNPFTGGGLTSIIYTSEMLAKHITRLEEYEKEVKRHPMASPVLMKARQILLKLNDNDVARLLSFITQDTRSRKLSAIPYIFRNVSLITKLSPLINVYRAVKISIDYGW
jgi:digeranylgeranylglycerophospholipid reductase